MKTFPKENFSLQEYLPDALAGSKLYEPGKNPREEEQCNFLKKLWKEKYGYNTKR